MEICGAPPLGNKRVWMYDYPGFLEKGLTVEKAVKLFFNNAGRKSTERIRRVAELSKAGTSAGTAIELDGVEAPPQLVAHISPLLVLVNTSQGVSAVLCMPQSFAIVGITKATDYSPVS